MQRRNILHNARCRGNGGGTRFHDVRGISHLSGVLIVSYDPADWLCLCDCKYNDPPRKQRCSVAIYCKMTDAAVTAGHSFQLISFHRRGVFRYLFITFSCEAYPLKVSLFLDSLVQAYPAEWSPRRASTPPTRIVSSRTHLRRGVNVAASSTISFNTFRRRGLSSHRSC